MSLSTLASALPRWTTCEGWDLQRRVHARRVADEVPDSCLLLEHEPVYTAGKRTAASDRPFGDPGAPVIDVDRGGKITWHGPGQLTGYPIVKLREPVDVVAYVRALEEAMIRACAEFGVTADAGGGPQRRWMRGDGRGPDRKVGAIGARVARGVTMHGLALNCRLRPVLVRPHRPVRHPRRRGDHAVRRDRAPHHRRRGDAGDGAAPGRGPRLPQPGVTSPTPTSWPGSRAGAAPAGRSPGRSRGDHASRYGDAASNILWRGGTRT